MMHSLLNTYLSLPLLLILFIPVLLFTLLLGTLLIGRTAVRVFLNKSRKVTVVPSSVGNTTSKKVRGARDYDPPEHWAADAPPAPKRSQLVPLAAVALCTVFLLWHFGVFGK